MTDKQKKWLGTGKNWVKQNSEWLAPAAAGVAAMGAGRLLSTKIAPMYKGKALRTSLGLKQAGLKLSKTKREVGQAISVWNNIPAEHPGAKIAESSIGGLTRKAERLTKMQDSLKHLGEYYNMKHGYAEKGSKGLYGFGAFSFGGAYAKSPLYFKNENGNGNGNGSNGNGHLISSGNGNGHSNGNGNGNGSKFTSVRDYLKKKHLGR